MLKNIWNARHTTTPIQRKWGVLYILLHRSRGAPAEVRDTSERKRGAAWMSDFSGYILCCNHALFYPRSGPLNPLAQQAVHRTFAANEMIFLEGEPSAGLWIVENGRVKAYKRSPLRPGRDPCIF